MIQLWITFSMILILLIHFLMKKEWNFKVLLNVLDTWIGITSKINSILKFIIS